MAGTTSSISSGLPATAPLTAELRELQGLADSFGRAMTTAFRRSVVDGKAFEDVLRSLALSLSSRALNQALAPIGQGLGSLFSGVIGTLFQGAGLGGGPGGAAPLSGVASVLAGSVGALGGAGGLNVIFNVATPDAQSFRRAEGELTAMLARAVARGQRGL